MPGTIHLAEKGRRATLEGGGDDVRCTVEIEVSSCEADEARGDCRGLRDGRAEGTVAQSEAGVT